MIIGWNHLSQFDVYVVTKQLLFDLFCRVSLAFAFCFFFPFWFLPFALSYINVAPLEPHL